MKCAFLGMRLRKELLIHIYLGIMREILSGENILCGPEIFFHFHQFWFFFFVTCGVLGATTKDKVTFEECPCGLFGLTLDVKTC